MGLFAPPRTDSTLKELLKECDKLRDRVSGAVARPEIWVRVLRRDVEAEAFSSSTRIEGFNVERSRTTAVVSGAPPESEGESALFWYTHAMRHVGVMAEDPRFVWSARAILDLHFDACAFQPQCDPGRIRTGAVSVVGAHGQTVYDAPAAVMVPALFDELIVDLSQSAGLHPLIAGAMAHLNLVSIHPFKDGNGRISRIVQSLVLAARGETAGEFGSIEPYLAQDSGAYYAVLQSVQGGSFQPDRNAREWVEFCLLAHSRAAQDRLELIERAAARWSALEDAVAGRGWPERLAIAMERALHQGCGRSAYAAEAEVSTATATNDLRRLLDAGLIEARGAGPSTRYQATDELRRLAAA